MPWRIRHRLFLKKLCSSGRNQHRELIIIQHNTLEVKGDIPTESGSIREEMTDEVSPKKMSRCQLEEGR